MSWGNLLVHISRHNSCFLMIMNMRGKFHQNRIVGYQVMARNARIYPKMAIFNVWAPPSAQTVHTIFVNFLWLVLMIMNMCRKFYQNVIVGSQVIAQNIICGTIIYP